MGQNFSHCIEMIPRETFNEISLVEYYSTTPHPKRNMMALGIVFAYIDLTGISFCECVEIVNQQVSSSALQTAENNFSSFARFFMSKTNEWFYECCFNNFAKRIFILLVKNNKSKFFDDLENANIVRLDPYHREVLKKVSFGLEPITLHTGTNLMFENMTFGRLIEIGQGFNRDLHLLLVKCRNFNVYFFFS